MSDDAERLAMANTYQRVFSDDDGRRVLEDLRRSYGDRRSFVDGDALATAFREGQRDVYLAVQDLIALARVGFIPEDDEEAA
jgi:F420-0:gamma-glutamyl ligase